MILLTKEILAKLPPLYANESKKPAEVPVVVKFFTPDGAATWFITEGSEEGDFGDYRLFGLCDLGLGFPELGYVMLSELTALRGGFGLPVERDLSYRGTLADAMKSVGLEVTP